MRPSSSPSDPAGLFDGVLAAGGVRAAVGDDAWVRALLAAEAALARAAARIGLATEEDAEAVVAACAAVRVDPGVLGAEAAETGNPVVPLVRRLRAALPQDAARLVHRGATSQDIVDTAAMLVARDALTVLLADLAAAIELTATLAHAHRATPVAGRTLLQQALPTTFGLVAAGWLAGLDTARRRLTEVRDHRLAAQLGGAAGTLAAYDTAGVDLLAAFSAETGLAEPVLPWHTERTRIADLAGALGSAAGVVAKVAGDLILYAQTEVGELAEGGDGGGSSAMPHKRNPVAAISAVAAAAQAPGLVATLLAAMPQEHQRAAGGWHAEWRPLRGLFESTGSAVRQLRRALTGLRVDTDRMRANLDLTGGALLAERVAAALRPALGPEAHDVVREALTRDTDQSALDLLAGDPLISAHLSRDQLIRLLDPATYVGCSDLLIDRALRWAGR
jgi:3-carboxy-cis,cis-muconate cycloisomerase